jgi:predicted RNase H-like nuclease
MHYSRFLLSSMSHDLPPILAGVDGCPGGWLAVSDCIDGTNPEARVFARFSALLATYLRLKVTAVDIPIGLPDIGPRACEIRTRLEGKRMSHQAWGIVLKVKEVDTLAPQRPLLGQEGV